jgi:riboflavin synthase alpha subunit
MAITVTQEAAQDFRALISQLNDEQVQQFLVKSIIAADAVSLKVEASDDSFVLLFVKETDDGRAD